MTSSTRAEDGCVLSESADLVEQAYKLATPFFAFVSAYGSWERHTHS
jgi:hypothetical protein